MVKTTVVLINTTFVQFNSVQFSSVQFRFEVFFIVDSWPRVGDFGTIVHLHLRRHTKNDLLHCTRTIIMSHWSEPRVLLHAQTIEGYSTTAEGRLVGITRGAVHPG